MMDLHEDTERLTGLVAQVVKFLDGIGYSTSVEQLLILRATVGVVDSQHSAQAMIALTAKMLRG